MLGVSRIAGQGLLDLLVDAHVDLDALLGLSLDELVKSVLLSRVRWATEEQLRRKPPIGNVDGLLGLLEGHRHGPEVIATVDIPLYQVAFTLGKVRLEAVLLTHLGALRVAPLFVFFVMAMVLVELRVVC
jgi:hypothetical protein